MGAGRCLVWQWQLTLTPFSEHTVSVLPVDALSWLAAGIFLESLLLYWTQGCVAHRTLTFNGLLCSSHWPISTQLPSFSASVNDCFMFISNTHASFSFYTWEEHALVVFLDQASQFYPFCGNCQMITLWNCKPIWSFILLGSVSQGQCFGLVCSGSPLKPISHRNTSCYPSFSTFNHSLGLQQIRTGYLDPFTHTQLHSAEDPGSWLQHGPALTIVVTWGVNSRMKVLFSLSLFVPLSKIFPLQQTVFI